MSYLPNELFLESVREDFYQATNEADWNECREILKDLEEKGIDTYSLRRDMNVAMDDEKATSEPEDFSNSTTEAYGN